MLGIKWAPLDVPLHRRLETFSAALWMFLMLFGEFITLFITVYVLMRGHIILKTLFLLYLVFVIYDRKCGETGGRGQGHKMVRMWCVWRHFCNYFPIDLVKMTDLPPNRNYLFACFPHGILSSGAFGNFATGYSKWSSLFPGIRSKVLTLSFHFQLPFFREFLLGCGISSVSADNLSNLLNAPNDPKDTCNKDGFSSNAAIIVVGGASEAIYCRPGMYRVVLKKRKGFVRMAIKTGAPIVPVFTFGETDLYDQPANPPGSLMRRYQEWFKSWTGMVPVFFIGRGFFQYNFGMIPRRRKLTTVIGVPMEVKKNVNPTIDEINEVHSQFCTVLEELFEKNKAKYIADYKNVKLEIE